MEELVTEVQELNTELRTDMDSCAKREGESLEFTRRVSDKNAQLQAENSALSTKLATTEGDCEELTGRLTTLETSASQLVSGRTKG